MATKQDAAGNASDRREHALDHRLRRLRFNTLHGSPAEADGDSAKSVVLDCGWGRLLFSQTFDSNAALVDALRQEEEEQRDIAFYVTDPHVLLSLAPQETFLDPSHTYRLELPTYRAPRRAPKGFFIRRLSSEADAKAVNKIYVARGMVPVAPEFFWSKRDSRSLTYFVAEDEASGEIIGTVTGVDHHRLFNDPRKGASLWCLAVDPAARHPSVGNMLVRRVVEYFQARGAAHVDLSVLHDNRQAIALYEKIGFRRIPAFTIKRRNPINEQLFSTPIEGYGELNPYARIIVDEARRRGIHVEISDARAGFFRLAHGGRSIRCRESLTSLTSAVAASICDDKAVTRRVVAAAGVEVPAQMEACEGASVADFLSRHGSVVVKPARGEQGRGIAVGLTTLPEVEAAVAEARTVCDRVLVEACFQGDDLRLVVIDNELAAAAVRRPPRVVGDGSSTIRALIEGLSRRRAAATGGESTVTIDGETVRCLGAAGHGLDTVLPAGEEAVVRKTANLHTGGTIHDVTDAVHPALVEAACKAARAIDIPVTGIDLMVKSPTEPDYVFIEANERPGLANHEPQPTAERFMDLLFPMSRRRPASREAGAGA
ncbi:N-acetylglutaminylglutamine synthetase [Mesorhizobium marinum]|uniref:N-acetylglutaminylglutamine synthetase n=1 Tax=Mesorhizobium marinum TaxID=3228790 RepID=UPI003465FB64